MGREGKEKAVFHQLEKRADSEHRGEGSEDGKPVRTQHGAGVRPTIYSALRRSRNPCGGGGGPGGQGEGGVRVKGGGEGAIGYCPPCGLASLQSLGGDPTDELPQVQSSQSRTLGVWKRHSAGEES